MKTKTDKIARIDTIMRFSHVVMPTDDNKQPRVLGVTEEGKQVAYPCTREIFQRVLGERVEGNPNQYHLGLRQLVHVKFRAHLDEAGVMQALDIVPNRMFTSGAAPSEAGRAAKNGFEVHWDEELQGFDVWKEHPETGDKMRIAYAGLGEKELADILDELRAYKWGALKNVVISHHKVERREGGTFRIRPARPVVYKT